MRGLQDFGCRGGEINLISIFIHSFTLQLISWEMKKEKENPFPAEPPVKVAVLLCEMSVAHREARGEGALA